MGIRKIRRIAKKRISSLLYLVSRKKRVNNQKLVALHNIHKGKRAFLICNGPSLSARDLDRINSSQEISIASNKVDRIFDQTSWRPTYYCVLDEALQYKLLDTMNRVPAKAKFFRIESFLTTRKVIGETVFLNAYGGRELLEHPKFSEDCSKRIYTIATVTYSMLQLLAHMGIREIYIIGCDNSYAREIKKDGSIQEHNVVSYFKGSNVEDMSNAAATWEMNLAYEYARRYADAHNIKIFNATRGGHLEAFERVNFDTLFEN